MIDEPKTDRDIPADATVPVRVVLDDDFGLQSARLIYRLATGDSEPREEVGIPLWTAPEQARSPAASAFVKHQEVPYDWHLTPLKLPVGTVITFYADARDFDAIKGPNIGKSREIRLRIVSKDDAARQFDDARRELREELARVLTMQKQAITPVDNAIRSLSQTDRLQPPQRDDLNNAGMIQRQVTNRINNRDEGVGARIRRMLEDLRNFKMSNPDAQKQMEEMLERLGVVRDQHLAPAEQGLSRATKSLDESATSKTPDRASQGTVDPPAKPAASDPSQPKSSETAPLGSSPQQKASSPEARTDAITAGR